MHARLCTTSRVQGDMVTTRPGFSGKCGVHPCMRACRRHLYLYQRRCRGLLPAAIGAATASSQSRRWWCRLSAEAAAITAACCTPLPESPCSRCRRRWRCCTARCRCSRWGRLWVRRRPACSTQPRTTQQQQHATSAILLATSCRAKPKCTQQVAHTALRQVSRRGEGASMHGTQLP